MQISWRGRSSPHDGSRLGLAKFLIKPLRDEGGSRLRRRRNVRAIAGTFGIVLEVRITAPERHFPGGIPAVVGDRAVLLPGCTLPFSIRTPQRTGSLRGCMSCSRGLCSRFGHARAAIGLAHTLLVSLRAGTH